MSAANVHPQSAVSVQPPQMQPPPQNAPSPPSKKDLSSWWKNFKKNSRKEEEKVEAPVGIFGVPLQESIKYANVAISLTNEEGESYIYGYVPIVVAKCGVFLKEKATDVEGIFRLSGSAKRIRELQTIFDSPDRYGKGLDWTGFTVHDAANILRRYLNQLPQPIVPLGFYEKFRDPLRSHQTQAVGDIEAEAHDAGDFDHNGAITAYQKLITELPPLNRQLLLYILDLLAVFASKAEHNLMNSANLAAIFQPGVLSNPQHDLHPEAYRLSQDVLIFLIENQDSFLVGMSGTEADEKTVKEVQSGMQRQPNTPTRATQAGLGRSASNASAGADSLRRAGGVGRNISVSSKNSKASSNLPSPASPAPGNPLVPTTSGGVYRSNTLPSKKSPGLVSRIPRSEGEPDSPTSSRLSPGGFVSPGARVPSPSSKLAQVSSTDAPPPSAAEKSPRLTSVPESNSGKVSKEIPSNEKLSVRTLEQGGVTTTTITGTPNKEKRGLFSKSPSSEVERKDGKQPNKLRKKIRVQPTSGNESAQSSTNSLPGGPESPSGQNFYTPMPTPGAATQRNHDPVAAPGPTILNTQATPTSEQPPRLGDIDKMSSFHISNNGSRDVSPAMKPANSPIPSLRSKTSATEESELEPIDEGASKDGQKKKTRRWRLSSAAAKHLPESHTSTVSRLGSSAVAEQSKTSVGSGEKPRKSITLDSQQTGTGTEVSGPSGIQASSNESSPLKDRDIAKDGEDKEKKGPIGWLKGKIDRAKEEREERKAEKERAKSPPRMGSEHATSKNSLGAIAADATRGRSADATATGAAAATAAPAEPIPEEPATPTPTASVPTATIPAVAATPPAAAAPTAIAMPTGAVSPAISEGPSPQE